MKPELEEKFKAAFAALVEAYVESADAEFTIGPPWTGRLLVAIYRTPDGVDASCLHAANITLKNPDVRASLSYKKQAPEPKNG